MQLEAVGQELVQRRIEQANRDRPARHRVEQPLKVALLEREQLVERTAASILVLGHDHRAHLWLAIGCHEHVLGAAQPDPFGAEALSVASVLGRVGVGAYAELAQLIAPPQDSLEAGIDAAFDERDVVGGDRTGRSIDRDMVPSAQHEVAHPHFAGMQIDLQIGRARHRRTTHATGDQRRVRGLAALGGEDPGGGEEPRDVIGLRERPHENHSGSVRRLLDRLLGREHNRALRGAR